MRPCQFKPATIDSRLRGEPGCTIYFFRPYIFLALAIFLLMAGMLEGCGSKISTSTLYDSPNWMPDGRIICNKLVITTTQQLYGTGVSESHGYIAALTINNNNEVIREENLFEGGVGGSITCSPAGELIAGIAYGTGEIYISDYKGNSYQIPNTSKVDYLDWSPDATKLVYSSSRDLYIINRDGTGKIMITSSAEAVAWRTGDKIAFEYVVGSNPIKISTVTSDGATINQLKTGVMPQVTNLQTIIFRSGGILKSMSISGTNETTLADNYDRATLKLSFDNSKIVGGALGDPGIWVINIDGTDDTRLR